MLIAALGSLATTDIECPQEVGLPGAADVDANAAVTEHYVVTASYIQRLHLMVSGTSAAEADVRVQLIPDDPGLFVGVSDGGPEQGVTLALRSGSESTADLQLWGCGACTEAGLSVVVEHLTGSAASVRWEVLVETESCDEDFHALIERR